MNKLVRVRWQDDETEKWHTGIILGFQYHPKESDFAIVIIAGDDSKMHEVSSNDLEEVMVEGETYIVEGE